VTDKSIKAVAIRMRDELSGILDDEIAANAISYNKPEFTMYAIRKTYEFLFYEFGIDSEDVNPEPDFKRIASAASLMDLCKKEFGDFGGDNTQYMIRIPTGFYDRITEICDVLSISMQDFIKGSIVLQMKRMSVYNKDYKSWSEALESIALEDVRSKIRQEQHNNLETKNK